MIAPRWTTTEDRVAEISEDITCYIAANQEVPLEWIEELNGLLRWQAEQENN